MTKPPDVDWAYPLPQVWGSVVSASFNLAGHFFTGTLRFGTLYVPRTHNDSSASSARRSRTQRLMERKVTPARAGHADLATLDTRPRHGGREGDEALTGAGDGKRGKRDERQAVRPALPQPMALTGTRRCSRCAHLAVMCVATLYAIRGRELRNRKHPPSADVRSAGGYVVGPYSGHARSLTPVCVASGRNAMDFSMIGARDSLPICRRHSRVSVGPRSTQRQSRRCQSRWSVPR